MVSTMKIFEFNIPRQDDLCYMVCNIVIPSNDPLMRYNSAYCRNKLKYREFLDKIPEVIAAPIDLKNGSIYVIVVKDLIKNPTFLDEFKAFVDFKYHLQISNSIYEMCLLNTVEHKLLGQWNKVGQYLVKGPDFLNLMETVNAIALNINIRDDENSALYAQLHMQAFDFQIPFLKLEGRNFEPGEKVYALPKLNPANVISRYESNQKDHPDVREYWRKMHGYTLPVNEEGLLFYKVQFFEKYFKDYNELGLTSQDLTPSPLENDAANRIYENFVEDLRGRVTTLCGKLVYPEKLIMAISVNLIIPQRNNLCCMVCKLFPILHKSIKLRYREFLDKIPEAMAFPIDLKNGNIYVIFAMDIIKRPTFQHELSCLMNSLGIYCIDPQEQLLSVSDSMYEMCLLNTIEHKLLGQWNKVGQYFVEGSNFLNSMENVNAIKLNISIRDNNAKFHMEAFNLRIPFLKPKDRDLQPGEKVYVLPSLECANVIKQQKVIQKDLYMSEYLKKIHGYILPVNEEELVTHYEVQFFQGSSKLYPEICLTSSQDLTPIPLENDAATKIFKNFSTALRERVTLCGQELYPEVSEV